MAFMKKKKAFTLVELLLVGVIGPFVIFSLAIFCIMQFALLNSISDFVTVSRESRIALDHMVRVLKFADLSKSMTFDEGYIEVTVNSGHLDSIPSDSTVVKYELSGDRVIYTQNGISTEVARYINYFTPSYNNDPTKKELNIKITASKGLGSRVSSISLQTTIKIQGDET